MSTEKKDWPRGLRYFETFVCHGCQDCWSGSMEEELGLEESPHYLLSKDITDELVGDDAEWVKKLRVDLMLSKMTHNFTFSRDEVIELMRLNLADAAHTYRRNQEIENLRALVQQQSELIAKMKPPSDFETFICPDPQCLPSAKEEL